MSHGPWTVPGSGLPGGDAWLRDFGAVVGGVVTHLPVAAAVIAGSPHRILHANRRFLALLAAHAGGTPPDTAVPEALLPLLERVALSAYPAHEPALSLAALGGGPADQFVRLEAEPVLDAAGAVSAVMLTAVDVTLEQRARHALEHSHQEHERLQYELRLAARRRTELMTQLAYELRTPLAPAITAIELVRLNGKARDATPECQLVERQLSQLARLADEVLRAAGVAQASSEGAPVQPTSAARLVSQAVDLASAAVEQKNQTLEVWIAPGPMQLMADEPRIVQVLVELLRNASRFTAPGGAIRLSAFADQGDIVFSVRDDGIGMLPGDLERVWEPFFQRTLPQDIEGGVGMGLAMARGIVWDHGGSVRAVSDGPGRGSEFTVRLRALDAGAPSPDTGPARSLRVLVVDDNVEAGVLLAELLQAMGHAARAVTDPQMAVAAAEEFMPELAILDIAMPGLDGYELLKHLRERPWARQCRFVALSAFGHDADRARSLAAGFERHYVKPIAPDELRRLVGNAIPRPVPA